MLLRTFLILLALMLLYQAFYIPLKHNPDDYGPRGHRYSYE